MRTGQIHSLILKVAERCNLNCSYCYMYNHEDQSYRTKPPFMSAAVFERVLELSKSYCDRHAPHSIWLVFHGGEPTLLGVDRFSARVRRATEVLGDQLAGISLQTNGLLVDDQWCDVLLENKVEVGVSLDGPASIHDIL